MSAVARSTALLLNADYRPIRVISWERAFLLLLEEKAELVVGYAGQLVRSVSLAFERPAVVRLHKFATLEGRVRFNRQNLLARDSYTCGYCRARPLRSGRPHVEELTLDHVIPRAQSRNGRVFLPWARKHVSVTCWENVVTACRACNGRKADRTPEQAGLRLASPPRVPTPLDAVRISLTRISIPQEWDEYIPEGWREYWSEELTSGE
jgi:5-methylcytosine-specific restriction endonuclease McrA